MATATNDSALRYNWYDFAISDCERTSCFLHCSSVAMVSFAMSMHVPSNSRDSPSGTVLRKRLRKRRRNFLYSHSSDIYIFCLLKLSAPPRAGKRVASERQESVASER